VSKTSASPAAGSLPHWRIWLLAIRPPTLGASVVPVLIGLALASRELQLSPGVAAATLACAVLLQISTNLANDYYDHMRGIDTEDRLGPTRVTQAGLLAPNTVRKGLILVLSAAVLLGAWLISVGGWPIAAIGVSAILGALAYSAGPWPLASYGFGEVLVFIFFGLCAVAGTHHLQGAQFDMVTVVAALVPACLAAALIVVNNLRDIPTDRRANKRTLAVRLGPQRTRVEYTALVLSGFAAVAVLAVLTTPFALLGLLGIPAALGETKRLWQRDGAELNASLVGTAKVHMIVGLATALGLSL
jgi:1,4-dihydroxy-2-naphthoate octaprenyltransferase